jgi:hypothetical protein
MESPHYMVSGCAPQVIALPEQKIETTTIRMYVEQPSPNWKRVGIEEICVYAKAVSCNCAAIGPCAMV